jgi:hypothetical protein
MKSNNVAARAGRWSACLLLRTTETKVSPKHA